MSVDGARYQPILKNSVYRTEPSRLRAVHFSLLVPCAVEPMTRQKRELVLAIIVSIGTTSDFSP